LEPLGFGVKPLCGLVSVVKDSTLADQVSVVKDSTLAKKFLFYCCCNLIPLKPIKPLFVGFPHTGVSRVISGVYIFYVLGFWLLLLCILS
jgi:hypothetical protein